SRRVGVVRRWFCPWRARPKRRAGSQKRDHFLGAISRTGKEIGGDSVVRDCRTPGTALFEVLAHEMPPPSSDWCFSAVACVDTANSRSDSCFGPPRTKRFYTRLLILDSFRTHRGIRVRPNPSCKMSTEVLPELGTSAPDRTCLHTISSRPG